VQVDEQRGACFGILARLLLIATDDIAAAFDPDLLHRQIGLALLARDGQRHGRAVVEQHGLAHFLTGPLACAKDVVDLARLECGEGCRTDHAAVGDNTGPLDPEAAAQPLDDRQQSGHIGSIAGPQEGGNRPVALIQHDAQHDLSELRAEVLGMAALAQRGAAMAFEIQ